MASQGYNRRCARVLGSLDSPRRPPPCASPRSGEANPGQLAPLRMTFDHLEIPRSPEISHVTGGRGQSTGNQATHKGDLAQSKFHAAALDRPTPLLLKRQRLDGWADRGCHLDERQQQFAAPMENPICIAFRRRWRKLAFYVERASPSDQDQWRRAGAQQGSVLPSNYRIQTQDSYC